MRLYEPSGSRRAGARGRGRAALVASGLAVIAALWLAASPYLAVRSLGDALRSGDADSLEDHVDFARLREDLKAQLNAAMLKGNTAELADNPFAPLALALGSKLVDGMVDAFVTPAGLAQLASGRDAANGGPTVIDRTRGEPFARGRLTRDALDRFSVWVPNEKGGEVGFIFRLSGVRWKLTGVRVPME